MLGREVHTQGKSYLSRTVVFKHQAFHVKACYCARQDMQYKQQAENMAEELHVMPILSVSHGSPGEAVGYLRGAGYPGERGVGCLERRGRRGVS